MIEEEENIWANSRQGPTRKSRRYLLYKEILYNSTYLTYLITKVFLTLPNQTLDYFTVYLVCVSVSDLCFFLSLMQTVLADTILVDAPQG